MQQKLNDSCLGTSLETNPRNRGIMRRYELSLAGWGTLAFYTPVLQVMGITASNEMEINKYSMKDKY